MAGLWLRAYSKEKRNPLALTTYKAMSELVLVGFNLAHSKFNRHGGGSTGGIGMAYG